MASKSKRSTRSTPSKTKRTGKVKVVKERVQDWFEIEAPEMWEDYQLDFIKTCLNGDTKIVFLNGPAGSSKTFMSTFVGLKLLQQRSVSEFVYVRTLAESASKGLGFLPGEYANKFEPYIMPLRDKLDEFLPKEAADSLLASNMKGFPVNFLRGSSFNNTFMLVDESQNFTFKELVTVITRLGKHSKFIICGDSMQSDINGKSGFLKLLNLFTGPDSIENGIRTFEFGVDKVMRSEQCKFILEKLQELENLK